MKKQVNLKNLKDEQFLKNDAVLANMYGVSRESILLERKRRNIPDFMNYRKQILDETLEK